MNVLAAQTATGQITGEELLALGDIGPSELIEGRIVAMVPTGSEHGLIELTLGAKLRSFVRAKRLGWVMAGEVGIYIRRHPDTVRAADLVFLSRNRSPERPTGFLEIAPDLVVEILSPSERWQKDDLSGSPCLVEETCCPVTAPVTGAKAQKSPSEARVDGFQRAFRQLPVTVDRSTGRLRLAACSPEPHHRAASNRPSTR